MALIPNLVLTIGIVIGLLVKVWLRIEISAVIQQCIGPKYAGPSGILEAFAEGTKLLFEEDVLPSWGDRCFVSAGLAIAVVSIFLSYIVIPFGSRLILTDLRIGVFLLVAILSIASIAHLMSGDGSNNPF